MNSEVEVKSPMKHINKIKISKSNVNCAVYGCNSVRKKNNDLIYHFFPKPRRKVVIKNEITGKSEVCDRRKLWEHKLLMGKKPSNYMKVCSLHFKKEDYEFSGWSSKRVLRPTAIPSENLPTRRNVDNRKDFRSQERFDRLMQRRKKNVDKNVSTENIEVSEINAAGALLMLQNCEPRYVDKEVQVNFEDLKSLKNAEVQVDSTELSTSKSCVIQVNTNAITTVCDIVKTDKQLNSLTGIHSFILFNMIVELLKQCNIDKRTHRLTVYQRVFLTFVKIKLDIPYVVLSVLFKVSSQTCKNIFFDTVLLLSQILKCCIPFPTKEEILQNMPQCFQNFQKVRIILDCTEIPVQRHKNLCCRIKCYSQYKGTTTIKFMTGVSPAGLITYVSPAYGGRASDKAIFERSGLLDELIMFEDQIMVDKGFLIEDLCESFGIKLIRPPFLRKKKQLSASEAIENTKIAAARVHIERSNQRIKLFKMLTNRLPTTVVPIIDQIFTIVCGIVNLSSPILADNKMLTM